VRVVVHVTHPSANLRTGETLGTTPNSGLSPTPSEGIR
jgi:hypothetical protein